MFDLLYFGIGQLGGFCLGFFVWFAVVVSVNENMSKESHIKENIKGKNAHAASWLFPKFIHILSMCALGGKRSGREGSFIWEAKVT